MSPIHLLTRRIVGTLHTGRSIPGACGVSGRLPGDASTLHSCLVSPTIGYRLSAIGFRLSAIGYRLSAIGYQLSAIGYQLSAIGYKHMLYKLIKPLLFRLDPERAHELVTSMLRVGLRGQLPTALIEAALAYDDPILRVECAGLHFSNPIGLAAGFDKHGELIRPMASLGFGHIELGTVTPRLQPGNPRPRMFRLPEDAALINRMGFNSPGMLTVGRNLQRWYNENTGSTKQPVLGLNIGKNRDTSLEQAAQDYLAAFIALAPLADYVAINISSPNTPGLRLLHERSALEELLNTVCQANRALQHARPLFLKISPDESERQITEVVEVGLNAGISGFIATNTTLAREGLVGTHARESGGLSGRPLAQRSLMVLRQLQRLTEGRVPLISVGGVADAEDAYQRLQSGASLVQIYTALIYAGPGLVHNIKRGLAMKLRASEEVTE